MDVKEKVTEVVQKIASDKALQEQFQKDPVKAVESVAGVDLPDDVINNIIAAVKAKLAGDSAKEGIGAGIDAVKGLFNK